MLFCLCYLINERIKIKKSFIIEKLKSKKVYIDYNKKKMIKQDKRTELTP